MQKENSVIAENANHHTKLSEASDKLKLFLFDYCSLDTTSQDMTAIHERVMDLIETPPKESTRNKCSKCGMVGISVTYGPDPYEQDINDNHENVYLCEVCRDQASEEI